MNAQSGMMDFVVEAQDAQDARKRLAIALSMFTMVHGRWVWPMCKNVMEQARNLDRPKEIASLLGQLCRA